MGIQDNLKIRDSSRIFRSRSYGLEIRHGIFLGF